MRPPIKVPFVREERFNLIIYESEDNSSVRISSPKTIEDRLKEHNLEEIGKHVYDMYSSDCSLEEMDDNLKQYHLIGFESVRVYVREYTRFCPCTAITVMVR